MEVSITPPTSSPPHRLTRLGRYYTHTSSFDNLYGTEQQHHHHHHRHHQHHQQQHQELKCLRHDGPKSLVGPNVLSKRNNKVKFQELQGSGVRFRRGGMGSETVRRRGSEDGAVMAVASSSGSLPPMDEAIEGSSSGGGVLLEEEPQDEDGMISRQRLGTQSRTKSETKKNKSSVASKSPTAVDPSITTLLREKDLRIQNLESQILRLETEFHTQISKQSQSEAENTIYWQQKCSLEHRKFLEADTELRLLKEQKEMREMEREEVKKGYEVLRGRLAGRDEEVVGLRAQVRGLKDFVSMSTRTDGVQVTSDKALGEAMGNLVYGLQQWVVTSYRKGKLREWDDVPVEIRDEVCELCPVFEGVVKGSVGSSSRVNKFHLLQGIVSGVLVEHVFGRYFAGLSPEDEERLREVEEVMRRLGVGEESVNSWRATTLATLRREGAGSGSPPEEFTAEITSKVLTLLQGILTITAGLLPPSTEPTLKGLVASAVELSRVLAVQKAVLRVEFPKAGLQDKVVVFENESMEDIGGDEEVEVDDGGGGGGDEGKGQGEGRKKESREVCCVVFPGLVKRGDEMGGSLGFRNVITKARVLCAGRSEDQ